MFLTPSWRMAPEVRFRLAFGRLPPLTELAVTKTHHPSPASTMTQPSVLQIAAHSLATLFYRSFLPNICAGCRQKSSAAKRALLRIHHACSPLSSHINQRSIATDWWSKRSFTMRWHDEFDHMLTTVAQLQWLYGSIQVETCWLAGEEIQHPVEIFAPSFKSNSCTLHYSIGSQIRCTVSS